MNVNVDILDKGTKVFILLTDFEESHRLQKEQGKTGEIWVKKIIETAIDDAIIFPYVEGGSVVKYYVKANEYALFVLNPKSIYERGIFLTRKEAEEYKNKMEKLLYGIDN